MAAPTSIRSKLDRAICAFLVSQGCGSSSNILPGKTRKGKEPLPLITVRSTVALPEQQDGNDKIRVSISIMGSATQAKDDPNPASARVAHDALIGKIRSALRLTDDDGASLRFTAESINTYGRALAVAIDETAAAALFARNNADMVDFTVTQWYDAGLGDGEPDDDAFAWEEILLFDAVACELNVD